MNYKMRVCIFSLPIMQKRKERKTKQSGFAEETIWDTISHARNLMNVIVSSMNNFEAKQYEKCFQGHMPLAEKGYPLAECQVGYFYYVGLGVKKDAEKAFYWTKRAAEHGDRDGQFNLACFYEEGIGTGIDVEAAKAWYIKAAEQNHDLAIRKCKELKIYTD